MLYATEVNLRRRIILSREIDDAFDEAVGHHALGPLLGHRGLFLEAAAELKLSTDHWSEVHHWQGLCVDQSYHAQLALLAQRAGEDRREQALAAARRALELADEDAMLTSPVEHDYVRAHWLLRAAQRVNGNLTQAERHLEEALTRCRSISLIELEGNMLIDLARLRRDTGAHAEAQALAEEALQIAERCEYVLQGADAHLELAKLALDRGDQAAALHHAREARRLATCDGPPDYTYKVAYDEAEELLVRLGAAPE